MITSRADHGGGPRHITLLLENLRNQVEFYIAAPEEGYYSEIFKSLCTKTTTIPHRQFTVKSFFSLLAFTKKNKIEIIHSHGRGAGYFARLLRIFLPNLKVVHTHHGFFYQRLTGLKRLLLINAERFMSRITDSIIFVSPSEMDMAKSVNLFFEKKSHLVPNGIPVVPWKEPKPSSTLKRLITVTRLEPEKGNAILIQVMKYLSTLRDDYVLSIVGDGPELPLLKSLVEDLGVQNHIQFLGYRNDVQQLYAGSDVFVSTSLGEAQGIALVEAMMHGIPVVVSKVLGHLDMIESGHNGFMFDIESPQDAAKMIDKLLSDETLWKKIRTIAYDLAVERFPVEKMGHRTEGIYRKLIMESSGISGSGIS